MFRFIYLHYRGCVVAGTLFLIGLSLYRPLSILQFYISALLFFGFLLFSGRFHVNSVTKIYTQNCDPEPYLEMALCGIHRFRNARHSSTRSSLANAHLCAVSSLCALGRYEEALHHLDILDRSALAPYPQFIYWHNRFSTLLHLNQDGEELARLLALAEESRNAARFPPSQQAIADRSLQYARLLFRIRQEGPSDEVVSQLTQLLPTMTWEYQRVHCRMTLAKCALERKSWAEARGHLEYVAEHGNKLYVRRQALELLDQLNAEEGTPC